LIHFELVHESAMNAVQLETRRKFHTWFGFQKSAGSHEFHRGSASKFRETAGRGPVVLLVAMLSLGGLCSANADPGPAENVHLARPGAVSEPEILPASGVATDSRLDSAPAAPAPANGATVGSVAAAGADDTALLD
jgi:hypothetical protein